jgi:hypothetical protein
LARPKKATTALKSIDDCTAAMAELLVATATAEKLAAEQALAVATAQAKHENDLNAARKRAAEIEASLEAYYYAHVAELETEDRQSYKLPNGVMGRRFSAGALAPLNRSWTWDAIVAKVREVFGGKYFRAVEAELNKDLLKDKLDAEGLAKVGCRVKYKETFYAEPTRPDPPSEVGA